jgi:membrane-anchored mycosin MYCP
MRTGSAPKRTALRLACVTLAAGLGTLVPSAPAVAQTDEGGSVFEPPPVNLGLTPAANDSTPQSGVAKGDKGCVTNLGGSVVPENRPWGQTRLDIDELHRLGYRGENMTVAVIDTGIRKHPWLKVDGLADLVDRGKNGLEDCDGHGTEVAGIIAADTPDNVGFKGVAPEARILSIRQSSEFYLVPNPETGDKDPAGNIDTLARAIRIAADRPEVSVINISIDNCRPAAAGMSSAEATLQRTLHYAVIQQNKVVVASAGNQDQLYCTDPKNGTDPDRPTSIVTPPWFSDYVLSVAAVKDNGDLAEFSVQGPWVSLAAPGTGITSLDPSSNGLANLTVSEGNGQPTPIQGTSFAAPYVAGVATLVRQKFPNLTATEVMERLKYTAQHPATPSGRDNLVGHGMVNPVAALTAMVPSEFGIEPDEAVSLPPDAPPVAPKNWTPMLVALIGSGSGLALLGITLFTMHTIRRNRPQSTS